LLSADQGQTENRLALPRAHSLVESWAVSARLAHFFSRLKKCARRYWFPGDGVGTKIENRFRHRVHSTVGGDLVNHCINDILTSAPNRFFFWITSRWAKWIPRSSEKVLEGVSRACHGHGFALWLAAKPPRCRTFYSPVIRLADLLWALSSAANCWARIA